MRIENLKDKMSYELQRAMINESYDANDIYAFARRCIYTDQLLRDIEEKTRVRNRQSYQSEKTATQHSSASASVTVSFFSQISKIVTSHTHVKIFDQVNSFDC
jgi:hypothetical protein